MWADLEPIVRIVPRARAYVTVPKDGRPRVNLSFSETFLKELGSPKKANIQAGTGDNAGKLRLTFGATGKFTLKEMGKGGIRVQMLAGEGVPDGAREAEACEVVSKGHNEAILSLPLEAWEKQVTPPARLQPGPAKPASPPAPAGPQKPLNAVEYLTSKGHRIAKERDGWRMDRELHTKASILTIINRYRRAAELPILGMTEFE